MKQWYVVQVYSGYEEAVKKDLLLRIKERSSDLFGDILVPSARSKGFFALSQGAEDERLFPGYVLVEMEKISESMNVVLNVPKVLRFLGGIDPVALTRDEVFRITSQIKGDVFVAPVKKVDFSIGNEVDICEGPFSGFVGIIDKVDDDSEKLTVMVSIFGRLTPVELPFGHVKK